MPGKADTGPQLNFLQKRFGPTFMRGKRKKDVELSSVGKEIDSRLTGKFKSTSMKKEEKKTPSVSNKLKSKSPASILRRAFSGNK